MPDPGITLRTRDERFENLPGLPYELRYREWRGIRLANIGEGSDPPVVMLHGERIGTLIAGWNSADDFCVGSGHFLYRRMLGPTRFMAVRKS
ncbi:MAG: hypothetical protein M3N10_04210 [Actinomycetota bacterium]|nr:hypothetical protein [Actinomycetota bacterium]